jgi:hypothetical protein
MGATLATLRNYIRAEVGDQEPQRVTTTSLAHDGASNNTEYFEDNAVNFVTEGVQVGDVIYNITDGGSLATILAITDGGGGSPTNARLYVSSIEGGQDNEYDTGDVVYVYDRYAQNGLGNMRWTNTDVESALAQAQKIVALRFGGVQKYSIHGDIKVMSKIDLTVQSGTFTVGEVVTGGGKGHTAVVEYVGDTFLVVSTFYSKLDVTAVTGTLETGELMTGGTSGQTGILILDGTTYLMLENHNTVFTSGETLTGGTSGATVTTDDADYAPGLFASGETLTGGTSSATANVKATYASNNICLGQDMPTDLKHLLVAKWWDGTHWMPLWRDSIREFTSRATVSGDPSVATVFGVDQLVSDSTPNMKIWLWPSNAVKQYNELHLFYMAWGRSLSADTDTTDFDNKTERLIVLEGGKILAGQVNEEELWKRLVTDIQLINQDITGTDGNETDNVADVMNWNGDGGADGGNFF